jgi:hypothetical protein
LQEKRLSLLCCLSVFVSRRSFFYHNSSTIMTAACVACLWRSLCRLQFGTQETSYASLAGPSQSKVCAANRSAMSRSLGVRPCSKAYSAIVRSFDSQRIHCDTSHLGKFFLAAPGRAEFTGAQQRIHHRSLASWRQSLGLVRKFRAGSLQSMGRARKRDAESQWYE